MHSHMSTPTLILNDAPDISRAMPTGDGIGIMQIKSARGAPELLTLAWYPTNLAGVYALRDALNEILDGVPLPEEEAPKGEGYQPGDELEI